LFEREEIILCAVVRLAQDTTAQLRLRHGTRVEVEVVDSVLPLAWILARCTSTHPALVGDWDGGLSAGVQAGVGLDLERLDSDAKGYTNHLDSRLDGLSPHILVA